VRDHHDPGVVRGQLAQHLPAVVGTAVVDEDDLVVHTELGEDRGETLVHDRDRGRIAVAGDHSADPLARGGPF